MKIWLLLLASVACSATVSLPSTPQTQLAARIEHAGTHDPCVPGEKATSNCLDDDGLVWSACAWNSCGLEKPCREDHQRKVAEGSCGEPDWPACKPGR